MFGFLKKKEEVKKEEILQGMKTLLLLNSIKLLEESKTECPTSYLQEIKGKSEKLHSELYRLEKIGLTNSQNYAIVKKQINELTQDIVKEKNRVEFLKFVKTIESYFPDSFIVEWDTFYKLLKKYNLMIGEIEDYTGVIPEKNITEIANVKNVLDRERRNWSAFFYSFGCWKNRKEMLLVDNVYIRDRTIHERDILSIVEGYYRKLLPTTLYRSRGSYEEISLGSYFDDKYDFPEFEKLKGEIDYPWSAVKFEGEILDIDSLLIAAPEKYLKEKVKVSSLPVDPIVFQPSPFGVIVHSVWGEEAEDKVLEEYMKINKIIREI